MELRRNKAIRVVMATAFFVGMFSALCNLPFVANLHEGSHVLAYVIIGSVSLVLTAAVYIRIDPMFSYQLFRIYKTRSAVPLVKLIKHARHSITFLGGYSDARDHVLKEGGSETTVLDELTKKASTAQVTLIFYGPTAMSQRFEFIYGADYYEKISPGLRSAHVDRKCNDFAARIMEYKRRCPAAEDIRFYRIDVPPNHVMYEFDGTIYLTLLASRKAEQSPVVVFRKSSPLAEYFKAYLNNIVDHLVSEGLFPYAFEGYSQDDELLNIVDRRDNLLFPASRQVVHKTSGDINERRRKMNLYPHRHSYCLIVSHTDDKPHVLLQQRSAAKRDNPIRWDKSAGGHVLYGESYRDACVRQVRKELGCRIDDCSELKLLARTENDFYTSVRVQNSEGTEEEVKEKCHFRLYMYFVPGITKGNILRVFSLDRKEIHGLELVPVDELDTFVEDRARTQDLYEFVKELKIGQRILKQLARTQSPQG